jgi:hypothetical protein
MVDEATVSFEVAVDAELVLYGDEGNFRVVQCPRRVPPARGILLIDPPSHLPWIAIERSFIVYCHDTRHDTPARSANRLAQVASKRRYAAGSRWI